MFHCSRSNEIVLCKNLNFYYVFILLFKAFLTVDYQDVFGVSVATAEPLLVTFVKLLHILKFYWVFFFQSTSLDHSLIRRFRVCAQVNVAKVSIDAVKKANIKIKLHVVHVPFDFFHEASPVAVFCEYALVRINASLLKNVLNVAIIVVGNDLLQLIQLLESRLKRE